MSSAKEHRRAVTVTSAGILLSRVLGYVRDVVITAVFGVGGVTDAYLIAFLIPNFFRRLAGEGALAATFIPLYAEKEKASAEEAERFAGSAIGYVFVILAAVSVIAAIAPQPFVTVFAPGLREAPAVFRLASELLRPLFPYLILMSVFAILSGILNTRGRFGAPAVASAFENIAVIAAALVLVPALGAEPEKRVWGLVAGVLVGGFLQVGVVWFALRRTGFRLRPSLERRPDLTQMLILMLPAAMVQVVYQFNNVVNNGIASFLAPGTITSLYLAYRVIEFPSALFGTAVGTVTLPKAAQAGTDEEFCGILRRSVRMCLLWMIPSMVALMVFAEPLMALLFQYGNVTADKAAGVANVLRCYAMALPFIGLSRILSSACFAVKETNLPLRSGVVSVVANILFSVGFVLMLPHPHKACGIALGMSMASITNYVTMLRMTRGHRAFRGFQMEGTSACAGVYLASACVFAVPLMMLKPHFMAQSPESLRMLTIVAVALSVGVYFWALKIIRMFRRSDEC